MSIKKGASGNIHQISDIEAPEKSVNWMLPYDGTNHVKFKGSSFTFSANQAPLAYKEYIQKVPICKEKIKEKIFPKQKGLEHKTDKKACFLEKYQIF